MAASVVSVGASSSLGQREHPRDVERDVAVPDDDRALVGEVELEVLEVGVAVVPGDELGRGPRAREVLAGDARAVGRSASRPRRPPRRTARSARRGVTSRPTSTLPRKRKPGRAAIFSKARDTVFSCGWSGATPSRTSPQGVGSRSIMSTSTTRILAREQRGGGVERGRPGADDCDAAAVWPSGACYGRPGRTRRASIRAMSKRLVGQIAAISASVVLVVAARRHREGVVGQPDPRDVQRHVLRRARLRRRTRAPEPRGHTAAARASPTCTGRPRESPTRASSSLRELPTIRLSSGRIVARADLQRDVARPGASRPAGRPRRGRAPRTTTSSEGVTIHWHGVDVPNAEDGVAGVTQNAVLPGETLHVPLPRGAGRDVLVPHPPGLLEGGAARPLRRDRDRATRAVSQASTSRWSRTRSTGSRR